ncbi:hypothetical protein [Corynebacterium glutamicum]|nr:hypothetical protein [Corynebacterium glutamicum]
MAASKCTFGTAFFGENILDLRLYDCVVDQAVVPGGQIRTKLNS